MTAEPEAEPEAEPITRWGTAQPDGSLWLTATAVAVGEAGVLFVGRSGAGKSRLALEMMSLGARLLSDDGVRLWDGPEGPVLERPAQAPALIEARGIGLLRAGPLSATAPLAVVVDLDRSEPARLPPRRLVAIGERTRPLIRGAGHPTLAPALLLLARHGRAEP